MYLLSQNIPGVYFDVGIFLTVTPAIYPKTRSIKCYCLDAKVLTAYVYKYKKVGKGSQCA